MAPHAYMDIKRVHAYVFVIWKPSDLSHFRSQIWIKPNRYNSFCYAYEFDQYINMYKQDCRRCYMVLCHGMCSYMALLVKPTWLKAWFKLDMLIHLLFSKLRTLNVSCDYLLWGNFIFKLFSWHSIKLLFF